MSLEDTIEEARQVREMQAEQEALRAARKLRRERARRFRRMNYTGRADEALYDDAIVDWLRDLGDTPVCITIEVGGEA